MPHSRRPASLEQFPRNTFAGVQLSDSQSGWLLPFMCGNCDCKFQVFLERMGVAEYGDIPAVVLPFNNAPGSGTAIVTIQPNTVPPGVYRIVACFMLTPSGSNASPCVAFADLGLAHWYQGIP